MTKTREIYGNFLRPHIKPQVPRKQNRDICKYFIKIMPTIKSCRKNCSSRMVSPRHYTKKNFKIKAFVQLRKVKINEKKNEFFQSL